MGKEDVVHIYIRLLLSHEKEQNNAFTATWMQLEIIMPSVSERERQISYDITYIQNRKYDTNGPIYEIEANLWT